MNKHRRLIILVLFAALVFDTAYYNLSWETPYGCGRPILPSMPGSTNGSITESNLDILGQPCFYIAYYAIIGSITIVIILLAPAQRPSLWKVSTTQDL